jgi:hypothetical protein
MAGIVEFNDDAQQYAVQNRPATGEEAAAIERLSQDPAAKQHSIEVERLAKLYDEKNVNLPTSKGLPKVGDTARVRHAHKILRGED